MTASLNPSPQTIAAIKSSIQNSLKADLPSDMMALVIAPLVTTVNQWSSQIPALLESVPSLNQVFEIRSLLFIAPRFSQNVFNMPFNDLPGPIQDFMHFIHKVIDAQKVHRDKPIAKVCNELSRGSTIHSRCFIVSRSLNVPAAPSSPRPLWTRRRL